MNRYSAIIADDEENLCSHLETLLEKLWPELQLIGIAQNGPEALSLIKRDEPDIAFLDIKMPVMSGIDVAKHTQGLCHVVFITAYDEFAIQAFEQDAIDYVLKPVTEVRLKKTIQRLQERLNSHEYDQVNMQRLLATLSTHLNPQDKTDTLQWIRVGKADKTIMVPVDEVIYFKASDKYTSVITGDGEYLIRRPIKELIAKLDTNQYWQISRSIIVNVNCIAAAKREFNGRCEVYLKNHKEVLMASRKYSHLFKQM